MDELVRHSGESAAAVSLARSERELAWWLPAMPQEVSLA